MSVSRNDVGDSVFTALQNFVHSDSVYSTIAGNYKRLRLLDGCQARIRVDLSEAYGERYLAFTVMFPGMLDGSATPNATVVFVTSLSDPILSLDYQEVTSYLFMRLRIALVGIVEQEWPADYFGPYRSGIPAAKNDVY